MTLDPNVRLLIEKYEADPKSFSPEDGEKVRDIARMIGRPMSEPDSSFGQKIGNAAYGLADSLLMGLLPEKGMDMINSGDRQARQIGSFIGALAPWAFVGKLGIASKIVGATSARFATSAAAAEGTAVMKVGGAFVSKFGKVGGALGKLFDSNAGALSNTAFKTKVVEGAIAGAWSNVFEDPGAALVGGTLGGATGGFLNRSLLAKATTPKQNPVVQAPTTAVTGQPPIRIRGLFKGRMARATEVSMGGEPASVYPLRKQPYQADLFHIKAQPIKPAPADKGIGSLGTGKTTPDVLDKYIKDYLVKEATEGKFFKVQSDGTILFTKLYQQLSKASKIEYLNRARDLGILNARALISEMRKQRLSSGSI